MKKISVLFFCFTVLFQANGQVIDGLHDKLFDQYLLGNYANCHDRAQKMIASDKYKYDPEPYLYISMCLVKLLEDPNQVDEYDNILKDALKFSEKSKKYNVKALKKEIITFPMDENLDFFDELIMIGVDEAQYHFNEDKFSKSASWFKKVGKIAPDDDNIQFAMAANMLLSRNMEGQKIMNVLLPEMKKKYSNGDEVPSEASRDALVIGFLAYSKYLVDKGESAKAIEIITFGHELMPDNRKVSMKFEDLTK